MRLNSGMTEPADFKKTAEFDVVRDSQVCVYARHADLFSFVSSIVYRAVQRFAEREEITMTGVSKLSAAVEKALRGFFSFLLLSHSFSFPFILLHSLTFSPPSPLPPPQTHTFFLFLQMQSSEAAQLYVLLYVCVHTFSLVCLHLTQKHSGATGRRFQIK